MSFYFKARIKQADKSIRPLYISELSQDDISATLATINETGEVVSIKKVKSNIITGDSRHRKNRKGKGSKERRNKRYREMVKVIRG